ncbi:hypothetical protein [Chryseobacterium taiwanense]|uniref:hypothetical protein n=1 Tax=Chryseobacterium taiwanense TaxID=363331 RepID=UPI000A92FBBE|nr:hypothetical protein [Chryseobacterium taiwanense]
MKIVLQLISISFLMLISNCSKHENKPPLLVASQKFYDLNKTDILFTIYNDSTYFVNKTTTEINENKIEKWKGKLKIKKDTIKFYPNELTYNNSKTAILKNGFVEFIDGDYPERMKIRRTSLLVKNNIDFKNLNNYAVFTFYKKYHNSFREKDLSNYELSTKELFKIDSIFKNEFNSNKDLEKYSDYLKQIVAVKNIKNEIIIQAHFYCKSKFLSESYMYYETSMMDGGNCNIYIELNLTTGKFNFINIAGIA